MPLAIGLTPPRLFVVRATGPVTYLEVRRGIDQMLAMPDGESATCVMIEAHDVTSAPSHSELRTIVRDLSPLRARGVRHIAIVSGVPHVYGIARMFSVFAELMDLDTHAFRTTDDARAWLRLRCDAAAPGQVDSLTGAGDIIEPSR